MLSQAASDPQRVMFEEIFTPGNIPEYGVAQNYQEVFAACWELCQELETTGNDPISDVPACVKTMRVQNFYNCVGRFIGLTNPTHMQRYFESESVRYDKDTGLTHSKKYRGYCRGTTLPGNRTVDIINQRTGVDWNFELHTLFWIILETTTKLRPTEVLLPCLCHDTVHRLARRLYKGMMRGERWVVEEYAMALLEIRGLTPLTALILMLRAAHENQDHVSAGTLAKFLAFKLMLMAEELQQRRIAAVLFRFAIQHLFPLAPRWKAKFSAAELAKKAMLLNLLPFCSNARTALRRLDQSEREEIMCLWLYERWGSIGIEALLRVFPKHAALVARDSAIVISPQLALANLAAIIDHKTGRIPLVMSRDYLDPNLRLRVMANHRRNDLKELLSQLG